ncbi:MAG: FKBP-type peptidyl-prolyl cis-trans isomerase [Patescibacteria group bacterium]
MQTDNNKNMILWVAIVFLVIGGLVFLSINNKNNSLENNQTNMENKAEGVKITVIQEGNGKVAKIGDNVSMNYTGRLEDGTVFDSNVDPKFNHVDPFVFTLGEGQVIKGWDVGVEGMKEGEKRTLVVAPEFGYGANGVGGVIPGNATLVFDVELVEVK